jgi:S-DNA-T family DNA segregation ATPase FtsK/SpoIIIE
MIDLNTLEKKIIQLEQRLKKLEDQVSSPANIQEQELMAALYQKARELVEKHHKTSAIFLQRKLFIDFARAERLLDELQANGVVGPAAGIQPRKILVKK